MKEKMIVKRKIAINNHISKQASSFNYLAYRITITDNRFRSKNEQNVPNTQHNKKAVVE
jgi:hypothetical protein